MDKNSPCFNCQTGWGNVSVFDGNGNIVNHGKVCFEECEKYKVSRIDADLIVNAIRAFANEIYSKKQNFIM